MRSIQFSEKSESLFKRLESALFRRIDAASAVIFRIAFGINVAIWSAEYFWKGKIFRRLIEPKIFFSYTGFEWIRPWPAFATYLCFALIIVCGLCVAIGLWYRFAAILLFVLFAHVFLLDQSYYLNHYYLILLMAAHLPFLPLNRAFSIDALRKPILRSDTIPYWALFSIQFLVALPYVYGGIAKLNYDWLIRLQPLSIYLPAQGGNVPFLSSFLQTKTAAFLLSYAGVLFDLFIVPLLIYRPTRKLAFAGAMIFHTMNHFLFRIGIFPWLMLSASTIYFSPDWPRRFFASAKIFWQRLLNRWGTSTTGIMANRAPSVTVSSVAERPSLFARAALATWAILFVLPQVVIPFRHFLYPGNVCWTELGYHFSWRMMLSDKQTDFVRVIVREPQSGAEETLKLWRFLTGEQIRKMSQEPELMVRFAHAIATHFGNGRSTPLEVRVQSMVSLNEGPPQFLVDPTVDLVKISIPFQKYDWITTDRTPRPPVLSLLRRHILGHDRDEVATAKKL